MVGVVSCCQVGRCGVAAAGGGDGAAADGCAALIPLVGQSTCRVGMLIDRHREGLAVAIGDGSARGLGGDGHRGGIACRDGQCIVGHGESVTRNGYAAGRGCPAVQHLPRRNIRAFQGDGLPRLAVGLAVVLVGRVGRTAGDGQGTIHRAAAAHRAGQGTVHIHDAVVRGGDAGNVQGDAFRDEQGLAAVDGEILRGGDGRAVDLALVALKDHAAPFCFIIIVANGACEQYRAAVVGSLEGAAAAEGAAADARAVTAAAGGGDGAAADGDGATVAAGSAAVVAAAVVAAADARAVGAAGGCDRAAADGDGAAIAAIADGAVAAVAAADARAAISAALGSDLAAADGDGAAVAAVGTGVLAAADARAAIAAGGLDRAAADGDFAAVASTIIAGLTVAAADARAAAAAGGGDGAAVDGDFAAVAAEDTAADARAVGAAVGGDGAAVDGDGAADARAADARAAAAAGGGDGAAVDGDGAAIVAVTVAGADGRVKIIHVLGVQLARAARLPVDGQGVGAAVAYIAVIVLHLNAAVDGESAAIRQNQVDIAADGDACADGHITGDHIPAVVSVISPCGVAALHHRGAGAGFWLQLLCAAVPVIIGHACRRRQRHRRQQAQAQGQGRDDA